MSLEFDVLDIGICEDHRLDVFVHCVGSAFGADVPHNMQWRAFSVRADVMPTERLWSQWTCCATWRRGCMADRPTAAKTAIDLWCRCLGLGLLDLQPNDVEESLEGGPHRVVCGGGRPMP